METRNITRRGVVLALAATGFAAASFTTRTLAQGSAAGAPGPVVMENEKVRVYAVVAKPGENVFGTGAQSHPPRLAVFMSDGKVSLAGVGGAAKVVNHKTGDLVWDAGETHATPNVGKSDITVYLVEPKGKLRPANTAPDGAAWKATSVLTGGKIVYENDYVRVVEHSAKPRMGVCGEGMHTHPDHVTIVLVGGRAKIVKPDKEPMIVEGKAGAVFWDPSGPHLIQNLGTRDSRGLLVELKTV